MTGWDAVLDALAAHLADQRAAVADGRPEDVLPFAPPGDLGPVPPALAERLRCLAGENAALEQVLSAAGAAVARQLQLVGVLHSPARTGASFVDARG